MYPRGWRYYRDTLILWTLTFLMLGFAVFAFAHPLYWILALGLLGLRSVWSQAYSFAHPWRRFGWMPQTDLEFREVTFPSRDGLTLFGRFLPGRNHAVILLLHGLGSGGNEMFYHAEPLVQAGFGVFLIDLRAHGSSDGDTSTFGLREADDVAGAVDYLLHRIDVDGRKIGVLGISLGAQAALRGALQTEYIHSLVLEGLGPSVLGDHGGRPKSLIRWMNYPANWLNYLFFQFMAGGRDHGVLEVISRIAPRPILFIASGERDMYFSRLFYEAAGEPKELWELPNGRHAAGFLQGSREYMQRVIRFFEKTLLNETFEVWKTSKV